MGLFDSNNASLQMLIGARQQKKKDKLQEEQLAMQKRQNTFGNITGAIGTLGNLAKAGFDAYDTLKLQPEREGQAFTQQKELEGIKHENALTQDKQRIDYETWAKQFDANSTAALSKAGIDQDVWKTMYTQAASSDQADKSRILENELTRYGIDQTMARQIAGQAFQKSERLESQDFQTAFAQLGSQLKKGELSYSADLEAKAAEKANEYATALAGTNTKNAMQIATAQSELDLARDIALQAARTDDQKQLIELEYNKRSEENAQKFGYDVSLLSKQTESTKEIETVRNTLGMQRDNAGYDYQTRRDEILHGFDMEGKQFDAATQKEIVGMQTAAEQALAKAKADYDMAMALFQSGDAKESDMRLFEQQLKLAKENHANTMLQLEAEYGYKATLQNDEQSAAIDQIRERGAIDSAINKANNQNSLSVANINKSADIAALQTRYGQEKESSILEGYSTPSVALGIAQTNARENLLSISKKEPTQLEINAEAAKVLQSDLGFFEGKGYTEAADVARRAIETITGKAATSSGSFSTPLPGTHSYVPGSPPGMPQAGGVSFSVGPGAGALMKNPAAWVDNGDGTEGRVVPNGTGGYKLETRPKSKK